MREVEVATLCTAVCVNVAKFESPTVNNACVQNKISYTQHRDLNFEHAHSSFVDHTKIARFTQTAVQRFASILQKFESPTVNNACVQNKISSTQHRDLNSEHAHTSFVDHTKIARFTQTAVLYGK